MRSLCLTVSRILISGWVGAASLFLVTTIQEARSTDLDSLTKGVLALLRFPSYYAFGFAVVLAAFVFGLMAFGQVSVGRWRMRGYLLLLAVALLLMAADYVWIYQPLATMLHAKMEARPASFNTYHNWSMQINTANLALCLLASLVVCWPGSKRSA